MAKFAFTQQINYQTLRMQDFLGVDFQNNPSEVALNRSPDSLNMIASNNSTIEKRTGFEVLQTIAGGAKVNGIHVRNEVMIKPYPLNLLNKTDVIYAHVGTSLYRIEGTSVDKMFYYTASLEPNFPSIVSPMYCVLADTPSLFIETSTGFYVISGGKILKALWYQFNPEYMFVMFNDLLTSVSYNTSYVPTTVIARAPTGGGTPYEAINAIQPKRKNSFLGTATGLTYQLDATSLDAIVATDAYGLNGGGTVTAQILQSTGLYTTITEGSGLTVNRTTGVVTFSVAPNVSPITGQDNVIITFYKKVLGEGTASYAISNGKASALFGMNGSDDYLFVGGSSNQPNKDFYGRVSDMYFPDTGYSRFGGTQSEIAGYSRMGDYLVVHKKSGTEDGTIYLRSATLDTDNEVIFPVKTGIDGTSAIASRSFQTFQGEPVFLSKDGLMALVSNNITNINSVQDRSHFIKNRLLSEANIQDAVSCLYDKKYMIFVNGKVYVADPRRKYVEKDAFSTSFQYEWYYWSGIDAKQVFEYNGTLYFGTSDGKICRMRKKGETNAFLDNATAVTGYWCSPVLFMGDMTVKKSLKNLWLRMEQYLTSEVKVYYRCRSVVSLAKDQSFDTASYAGLDFNRLTFETSKDPEVVVTNRVERQFLSIQFKFLNDVAENFGLIEVVAKYRVNSAYKGG